MVRHGSSSSRGFDGVRRRSGSRGRGLARDARGGQEGGPRGRERARLPGTAMKAAWTATAVDVASMSSAERRELLAKLGGFMGGE